LGNLWFSQYGVGLTEVIIVRGSLERTVLPELREALIEAVEAGTTDLIVDLREVGSIDSSALTVLLNAQRRMARRGGGLSLVSRRPDVLRTFARSRLGVTFELYPNTSAALKHHRRRRSAGRSTRLRLERAGT
jgi:anti-anti-sigma factor